VRYGYHYWSQVWDRDLKDVFAVQEDIARRVADSVRYNVADSAPLVRPPTHDLEAYNLFLQGRFYEHRVFSTDKAIAFFHRAIDKDPNFALAYTGLATCYADLGYYNQVLPREAYPKAVAALRKARPDPRQLGSTRFRV
jgi:serine/threonine-protein kinase